MGYTVIPITINMATGKLVDPDNSYYPLREKPRIPAENYIVLGVHCVDSSHADYPLGAGDTFEAGGDADFIHDADTGALSGTLTAAASVTSITATGLTPADVPATGRIRIYNSSNEYELIDYTEYDSATGVFTVSHTMTYSYANEDRIVVNESLMFYSGNDQVDIADDWDDIDRTAGKFSIRVRADADFFKTEIGNDQQAIMYLEIRRYPNGETKPSKMLLDTVWAENTVINGAGEPGTTSVQFLNETSADSRYIRQALSTAYSEQATITDTDTGFIRTLAGVSKYFSFSTLWTWANAKIAAIYATLVPAPTLNNILITDAAGQPQDSGYAVTILGRIPSVDEYAAISGASTPTALNVFATMDDVVSAVEGLYDDRGNYDASVNTFPATGGSGAAGAILKGDIWTISVAGTLDGNAVTAGDTVRALQDTPGQTGSNWAVNETNIGYVAENSANKVTSISGASTDVQYPSAKLLYDQLALKAPIDSPVFTTNITTPIIKPSADSTTAIQITKADGTTPIVTIDSTNSTVAISTAVSSVDVISITNTIGEYTLNNHTFSTPSSFIFSGAGYLDFNANSDYVSFSVASTLCLKAKAVGVGIMGIETASAYLHIAAGTAAAGTSPFKFTLTDAVVLTSPEPGVFEPDATGNLYFTNAASARKTIAFTDSNITGSSASCTGNAVTATTAADLNIAGLSAEASPASGMKLVIDNAGTRKKIDWDDLPGAGGGEINTASNTGSSGVGVYKQKSTYDLELYKVLGSDGVSFTLNGTDYLDVKVDISSLDAEATPASGDYFIMYDGVAGTNKKVDFDNMPSGAGDMVLASIQSVTGLKTYDTTKLAVKGSSTGSTAIASANAGASDYTLTLPAVTGTFATTGGYRTINIDAAMLVPATTNPPEVVENESTTNKVCYDSLDFAGTDGSADEIAWFKVAMPDEWDRSTVKVKLYWEPAAGASASDNVRFTIAGGAISNDDAIDAALGSAVNIDDAVIAVGDLHITPASGAITVGGSPALADMIFFKITRDYDYSGGGTGMAEDAKLLHVVLQYKELTTAPSGW